MRITPYILNVLLASICAVSQSYAQTTRDWRTWPFSQNSPWNMPIGSGAIYSSAVLPTLSSAAINAGVGGWSTGVGIATASDPLRNVYSVAYNNDDNNWTDIAAGANQCNPSSMQIAKILSHAKNGPGEPRNAWSTTPVAAYHSSAQDFRPQIRWPAGLCPSPDTDGLMTAIQPDGWALETYATIVLPQGPSSHLIASFFDLKGDGTGFWNGRRASMVPSLAGLIRNGEIRSGRIPHALVTNLHPSLLAQQVVWPAWAYDTDTGYSGNIPMGSLLALPASVNIDTCCGLTEKGRILARAAQDYGIYVMDRGGGQSLYAELAANPEISWSGVNNDVLQIYRRLARVMNNSAINPGGPGTTRSTALAPHFADATNPPQPTTTNPVH